jgi:hypothetical protein
MTAGRVPFGVTAANAAAMTADNAYVGIDLLSGRDVRVAQDDLCIASWHVKILE